MINVLQASEILEPVAEDLNGLTCCCSYLFMLLPKGETIFPLNDLLSALESFKSMETPEHSTVKQMTESVDRVKEVLRRFISPEDNAFIIFEFTTHLLGLLMTRHALNRVIG